VDELDADEGVCHARAGTPLSALRGAAAARGWELPLDAPGANTTVGGALAAAALGPRAQGYGPPRDAVLGLEVALASGERTRCGGRVVKNVTGYDLNKLYTGSLGTLGVIEGAWLRLRPAPARTAAFEGELTLSRDGFRRSLSAARRATTRAAALVRRGGAPGLRLSVELGGHAAAVERDAGWLVQELGLAAAPEGALDRVRALQAELPGPGGLRLRLAARPSRLWPALERLASGGAALLAYPGLGLLYVGFELAAGEDAAGAIESVAQRAREAAGSWMIEAAPAGAKAGRDVFGDPTQALALTRSLKQQFDPDGLLNAGRFAGHV
jgi:glycolate oxidase FAD binding subunit